MGNHDTAALIFICHSSKDKDFTVEELVKQLKVLQTQFKVFVSEELEPGDQFHKDIRDAIEVATAAVLVVSPDSLISDFILEHEVPRLLRREREGLRIIPLIWRPSPWRELEWLSKNNAYPPGGKPELCFCDENKRALVLSKLAVELSRLIAKARAQRQPEPLAGRRRSDRAIDPKPERVPRRSSLLVGRGPECLSRHLGRRRAVSLAAGASPASDRYKAQIRQHRLRSSEPETERASKSDA